MADRWFVVPTEQYEETNDNGDVTRTKIRPKYSDTDALKGFTGSMISIGMRDPWAVFATAGYDTDYYVVRFYGPSDALDRIASNDDATDLSQVNNTKYWVQVMLNDLLNNDLTADEWVKRFEVKR
jgi:hypothetical protein